MNVHKTTAIIYEDYRKQPKPYHNKGTYDSLVKFGHNHGQKINYEHPRQEHNIQG